MTLVDNHGRVITEHELAASYTHDLRVYCELPPEEIERRLWERYPAFMRWCEISDRERTQVKA